MTVLDHQYNRQNQNADAQFGLSVHALQKLFPPHPYVHSVITRLEGTRKDAPQKRRAADVKAYERHLASDAFSGVGGLGMYLGQRTSFGSAEGVAAVWSTPFVALDFDHDSVSSVCAALVNTLTGFGFHLYMSIGTTGRGAHLYIFFDVPLIQGKAHHFVTLLQGMAREAGLGVPELRPSSASGTGSPIFLPYRGADVDGYGYNSLLEASNNLRAVALLDAPRQVKRTGMTDVITFIKLFEHHPEAKPNRAQPINMQPMKDQTVSFRAAEVTTVQTSGNELETFRAELGRIAPHFLESKRQNLIMGVTAYGVRALGLTDEEITHEVVAFLHATDGTELNMRLEAIRRTIGKHREGSLVAWHYYYDLADVAAPPGHLQGPPTEVLDNVERAKTLLERNVWQPRTGNTDRAAFAALLTYATSFGRAQDMGFSVCVSTRELALKAGISHQTLLKAIKRLISQGLVQRVATAHRRVTDSGELAVMMAKVSKLYHSSPPAIDALGGLNEWSVLHTHPAFRHARLNKSAIGPLAVLIETNQALTRSEMAKRLGKKSRALSKPLEKLLEHALIVEVDRRYKVIDDWRVALDCAAHKTGALFAEQQDKNLYEVQRHEFSKLVNRNRRLNLTSTS